MTAARLDRSSWPVPPRPPRIVHLGVGNFSRAHQAWYTMTADPAREWGIVAFTGRRPQIAELLARQDGLYALIERGPAEDRVTVIDAIVEARPGGDLERLNELLAAPGTAVVTVTITEGGYEPPLSRASALGRLTLALAQRRRAAAGPIAIVSCDNLHANGDVLRARTLALAGELEPGLGEWIEREVAFVSASVDRITPPATAPDRRLVQSRLGLIDDAPVVCEPFSDWVLCGDFPAGRPAWELAGARFVSELEPWELRKLWLLNGGHSLLAHLGLPRGHATVAAAIADPELAAALERFWDLAERHLPGAELDLPAYRSQLRERFANARIAYPLTQIAADALAKLRNRVVPVVEAATAAGEPAEPALLVLAAWAWTLIGAGPLASAAAGAARNDAAADAALNDSAAGPLRDALARGGGEDRLRALLELLAPGWSARDDLIAAVRRLGEQLGAAAPLQLQTTIKEGRR